MHTSPRVLSLLLIAGFLLQGSPVLQAQEQQAPTPVGSFSVEQTSDVGAVGVWTILRPNHESFERTDAKLNLPGMMPGQYSFFTVPPKGTHTHIDLFLGDDVIETSETPQMTFELKETMSLRIVVTYTLAIFGKVGINSEPTGMPFTLVGPDNMKKTGVTPTELSPLPIGNYSVTYKPAGCPQPSAKSGLLKENGRVDFMVKIVCEGFRAEQKAESAKTLSTEIDGQTVTFSDVPTDAWFAPFIATVANRGIMSGYTKDDGSLNGTFGPGDPVTIAQLAKIVHLLIKIDQNAASSAPINPLAGGGQWFTRYIASAEDQGWLVYEDGTADPNRPATRGEVVITLLQALDIPMHWPKGAIFTDVERKTPYSGAIETAAKEGIVSGEADVDGSPTGFFLPGNPITRAEIAKILIGVYEKYLKDKPGM